MSMSSIFSQPEVSNSFLPRKKKTWLDVITNNTENDPDPITMSNSEEDPVVQGEDPPLGFSEIYNQLANVGSGPKAKAYADYVANAPTREGSKPGKLDRLAAILSGASEGYFHGPGAGIKVARNILDDKYNEAVQDYSLKERGLKAAAMQEESDMGRKVTLARNISASGQAAEKSAEQKRLNDSLILRRKIQNTKDQNPEAKFETIDGKIVAVNPKTLEKVELGDAHLLSPDAVQQKNQIENYNQNAIRDREVGVAKAVEPLKRETNKENQSNIGTRQIKVENAVEPLKRESTKQRIQEEGDKQVDVIKRTLQTKVDEDAAKKKNTQEAKTEKGATPAAQATEAKNRMKKFLAKNPDAKKYFEVDAHGVPTAVKPASWWQGNNKADYDTIVGYVYGKK